MPSKALKTLKKFNAKRDSMEKKQNKSIFSTISIKRTIGEQLCEYSKIVTRSYGEILYTIIDSLRSPKKYG